MTPLLAKSSQPGREPKTLLQHTLDVMNAAEWLFGTRDTPTRLGREWLRFFKVPLKRWPTFLVNLLASAGGHDWGKANSSFQQAVLKGGEQVIRHEHLSALMLGLDPVTVWLRTGLEIDTELVLSAVLTHHLKAASDMTKRHAFAAWPGGVRAFQIHDDHAEFIHLVQEMAIRTGLVSLSLPLTRERCWSFRDGRGNLMQGMYDLEDRREKVRRRLRLFEDDLSEDEPRRRMLWAIRAGLIAADAVGSGLPRVGENIRPWIEAAFDEAQLYDEAAIWSVIDKRIEQIKEKMRRAGTGEFRWDDFQRACSDRSNLPDRGLLLAPCGAGKTLAAWRWIAAQVKGWPTARVLFLYPTRATAKEGFRDYVSWAPEADAALMHGTAAYDLQGMFANPDDPRHGRESQYEVDRRLFALGFWTRRVFSATVDQFLAFMQYGYGPMCMLPVLADAVVVIDEVHSFDRNMFTALKDFLRTFDVPVLCMTATLPGDRRRELEDECGLKAYDERPGDLAKMAMAPRYRLRRVTEAEARARINQVLNEGRRVLWVVNQVRRAQQAALDMACDFQADAGQKVLHIRPGVPLFCYHSRFKLDDRVQRHNDVVENCKEGCPAALSITTQVCEMSLDLDADLLVTEECPITSLIQRMGRCNRARSPRSLRCSGEVLVYKPEKPEPYDVTILTGVEEFLAMLTAQESVSQADLEEALRNAPAPPVIGDPLCSFLTSGAFALSGEEDFRDIEEFSNPAILNDDVPRFLDADKAKQPGFVVPVPRYLARLRDDANDPRHGRLPRYLRVAATENYHRALGFCDKPIAEMKGGR